MTSHQKIVYVQFRKLMGNMTKVFDKTNKNRNIMIIFIFVRDVQTYIEIVNIQEKYANCKQGLSKILDILSMNIDILASGNDYNFLYFYRGHQNS